MGSSSKHIANQVQKNMIRAKVSFIRATFHDRQVSKNRGCVASKTNVESKASGRRVVREGATAGTPRREGGRHCRDAAS